MFRRFIQDFRSISSIAARNRLHKTPTPFGKETFDFTRSIFDDPYLRRVAIVIERYAPMELAKLQHGLVNSVKALKSQDEHIVELESQTLRAHQYFSDTRGKYKEVSEQLRRSQIFFSPTILVRKLTRITKNSELSTSVISMCLSLMVFTGLCEIVDIEFSDPLGEIWIGILVLFFTTVSINLGVKYGVSNQVFVNLIRANPSETPKQAAFWTDILGGKALIWISMSLVLLEVLFTFYFLLQRLPLHLRDEPLAQTSVFFGAGYLAYINVFLAWTSGQLKYYRSTGTNLRTSGQLDDILGGHARKLQELEKKYFEVKREFIASRWHLKTVGKRYKLSKSEYKKLERKVIIYTQECLRGMSFIYDDIVSKNNFNNGIMIDSNVLDNGKNGHNKKVDDVHEFRDYRDFGNNTL